ncbi:hypothetical protein KSS87_003898 [Heliosperma pusillum]|nr:hypothetical protein KSS87_003898 [Heliosperma pusillum]
MGKAEDDEFSLASTAAAEAASLEEANRRREEEERSCCCNFWFKFNKLIKLKCIFALLLGFSVFISALFWLPPFLKLSDLGDKDLDPRFRDQPNQVTFKSSNAPSFELVLAGKECRRVCSDEAQSDDYKLSSLKPVSFVKDYVSQLEADIYDELEAANAKVVILSLEGSGLNSTNVVFGIDPLSKRSKISLAELSLIRSYFGYFVTRENKLLLTTSLFGEPSFFEVLKFPGGITISPSQHIYPLQKVQIYFNFTLNNSILQIQDNFEVLVAQLNSGLRLTPQETLYIRLTNYRGSTVAPPSIVQASVVLTVGAPSVPRMKQLAKTIKDSPARNLGLNNTVFGKVKQVSLSSILPASGASSPTLAPSPGPVPQFHHHHHHHHHHNHHHHHSTYSPPPSTPPSYPPARAPRPIKVSPAPMRSYQAVPPTSPKPVKSFPASPREAPAPVKSYHASPPGCRFGLKGKHSGKSPEHTPTPIAIPPSTPHHHPKASLPHRQAKPPTPASHQISPSSRFPYVIYARAHPPPSGSEVGPQPPNRSPSVAPLPSSGGRSMVGLWILSLLVVLLWLP